MSPARWLRDKWLNRLRQFGIRASVTQVVRAAVRPVYRVNCQLILAIPDHRPDPCGNFSEIRDMTVEAVDSAAGRGELTEPQERLLKTFLAQGCRGFLAEVDDRLAGYAFVQSTGTYPFGPGGRFQIPTAMMVLKNLLVFPGFRGHSLGKKLNQARIAAVPEDQTPLVFVMTENRFAIRNLKMFGFEEMLIVTRTTWFRRWSAQRVRVLCDSDISRRLIQGLKSADRSEEVT